MSVSRFRDAKLYYLILGCAVTSLYFLLLNSSAPTDELVPVDYRNISPNYQYGDICSEWKLALKQAENQNVAMLNNTENLYSWNENDELNSIFTCDDSPKKKYISRRGNYYVIYNFVMAEKEFGCTESITLSAPGDYRFLDNVVPLVDRWTGPISIALYTPGHDFTATKRSIAYLRQCQNNLIKELVSFHVFFDMEHMPKAENGIPLISSYEDQYNCSLPPPWETNKEEEMYKVQNHLLYPINVARNVARLAAKTYFVFPSDIELYPTRNFIQLFFTFVKENMDFFTKDSKNVFVLPIFEILENQLVPENKTELLTMLAKKTAIVFHQSVCLVCHRVIDSEKWVNTPETFGLGVFSTGKRQGRYMVWEPFFVCTQKEPLWDERFSWEGQGNKMVQAFTMCVMDYDFHILDNAFLIHKPGVKKKKVQIEKFNNVVAKSNKLIKTVAIEIQEIYGYRSGCRTNYAPFAKPRPALPAAAPKTPMGVPKTPMGVPKIPMDVPKISKGLSKSSMDVPKGVVKDGTKS